MDLIDIATLTRPFDITVRNCTTLVDIMSLLFLRIISTLSVQAHCQKTRRRASRPMSQVAPPYRILYNYCNLTSCPRHWPNRRPPAELSSFGCVSNCPFSCVNQCSPGSCFLLAWKPRQTGAYDGSRRLYRRRT